MIRLNLLIHFAKYFLFTVFVFIGLLGCNIFSQSARNVDGNEFSNLSDKVRDDSLTVFLGSTDLSVGFNRVVFGLLDSEMSHVRTQTVTSTFIPVEISDRTLAGLEIQTSATFMRWPVGSGGVYVAKVEFPESGKWRMVVEIPNETGVRNYGLADFVVNLKSSSPSIGAAVPLSNNKILGDPYELTQLTTSSSPDPELYELTINQSVSTGKPTVIVFASPAFCTSGTCGPQVKIISEIKNKFRGLVNFIHVEVYDNPDKIDGDLSNAEISPLMQEWGLLTEPFTFLIDSNGFVYSKFEGFVTAVELEESLDLILEN